MAIDFPSTPTVGQQYVFNNVTYTYTAQGNWVSGGAVVAYAPINSPVFTGDPKAPTPSLGDNDTSIATTAFVQTAVGGGGGAAIPVGTSMLFFQAAAPTGWTQVVTHNNKALRIVNTAGGGSGGTVGFSTLFGRTTVDNWTLTVNDIGSHAHTINDPTHLHADYYSAYAGAVGGLGEQVASTQFTGSVAGNYTGETAAANGAQGAHSHGLDMRVQYVDTIICTKN